MERTKVRLSGQKRSEYYTTVYRYYREVLLAEASRPGASEETIVACMNKATVAGGLLSRLFAGEITLADVELVDEWTKASRLCGGYDE